MSDTDTTTTTDGTSTNAETEPLEGTPEDGTAGGPVDAPPRHRNVVIRAMRRLGAQGARILLLVVIVALSGMALGYAFGYPLRFVDYEASNAVALDQASLSGTIDVAQALVTADDLGPGWAAGDPALGSFGVLGADVCGETLDTPTPLSAKEAAVFVDETNGATVIAQALRVENWTDAREYVDDVAAALDECDTFFRVNGETRTKVTSTAIDRDPPITDHVERRYQSPDGVQEWSMMAVGDVIVAIQYLAPTPPPEGFLEEVERSVLARIAPREFTPAGVGVEDDLGALDPAADPAAPAAPVDPAEPAAGDPGAPAEPAPAAPTDAAPEDGGAADETGGP